MFFSTKTVKVIVVITTLNISTLHADNTSFGLGLGAPYNGLGVNVTWTNNNSMKYIALGCASVSGSLKDIDCDVGVGLGYINTSVLSSENNNHGLGIHTGISNRHYDEYKEFGQKSYDEKVYTLGISYTYFFDDINNTGWNVGFTPLVEFEDSETDFGVYLGVGYQF